MKDKWQKIKGLQSVKNGKRSKVSGQRKIAKNLRSKENVCSKQKMEKNQRSVVEEKWKKI